MSHKSVEKHVGNFTIGGTSAGQLDALLADTGVGK